MKKLILLVLLLALPVYAAGPRSWGKTGTATTTNATLTVGGATPFGPTSLCIDNLDTTDDIYVDWSDGVATTTDNSTNIKIIHATGKCFNFSNPNVLNSFTIGILASANTPAYNIVAIAYR